MDQIFISYSRMDVDFALKLSSDLETNGISTWIDKREIKPGQSWDLEIPKALDLCNKFIVILTPKSVESKNILDEIAYAIDNNKTIVPIFYKDCEIPFRIRRIQYIDFINNYSCEFEQLLKILKPHTLTKTNNKNKQLEFQKNISNTSNKKTKYIESQTIKTREQKKYGKNFSLKIGLCIIILAIMGVIIFSIENKTDYYSLGLEYYKKSNYNKAYEWYKKAADQGDSDAQYNIGVLYRNGHGVKQNYNKAYEWYKKAANQGNSGAQYNIGVLYDNGYGVEQNYNKAYEWYKKAANQGNSNAQYNIGVLYDNGHGVEQNYNKAYEWYKKAADQGDSDAQNNIGVLYDNGHGVEQNYNKAYEWYKKAADQGNSDAQNNIEEMDDEFESLDKILGQLVTVLQTSQSPVVTP